jgi:hypothetical protein
MKPLNQSKNLLMSLGLAFLTQAGTAQNNTSYTGNTVPILGNENTALGTTILTAANASSAFNVGVGRWSLISLVSGVENVALGNSALGFCQADSNSAGGHFALGNVNSGNRNTAFGNRALTVITSGNRNTALGALSNSSANNLNNSTAIGYQAIVNASDRLWLGNTVATVWTTNSYNVSDQRFKSSVKADEVKGLEFINLLRPVVYNLETKKLTEHMTQNMPADLRKTYLNEDFSKSTALRQSGFLAQEVEEAAKKAGYNFSGVYAPEAGNNTDTYGISYATFVVPLVKAVQELDQQKAALQQKVDKLEKQVQDLLNKTGSATGINPSTGSALEGASMEQNIPNPFSNETVISYNLPQQVSSASLVVYDLSGKQIVSFPITEKGASSITLTSEKLAAGIYIYSVMADGKILDSKRMVVAQK